MDELAAVAIGPVRLVVPSVVASMAVFLWLRRISRLAPYALVSGLTTGFLLGYAALPEWAPLVPERHWHWLPYLGMAGAVAGAIATMESLRFWRHLATLLTASVAAWLLVPTWPALAPSRALIVTALTVSLVAFSCLLAALAKLLPARECLTYLVLTSTAVAVCTAAAVSLKSGQVAGVLAASVAGCCAASWLIRGESKQLIAMIPCYAILAGGVTFVGFIEPDPPFYKLLLIPIAPTIVWLAYVGRLGRLEGGKAVAARGGLVIAALALACGIALH